MSVVYLALGVALLASTIVDLLWTTLWVEGGAGPLMSRLMPALWRGLRRIGDRNSRVLSLAGPLILVAGLAMWIGLLLAGWTFVFANSETALVDTRDGGPISWSERFYYIGYTVFTLGNGDFTPRDGVWQVATALATATGMVFVTLSVTYILSVLEAITQKRSFASNVSGLGLRGETIVERGWEGETFRGLKLALNTFTSQLNTLTTTHNAYPILHYFHSEQDEQAPVISISVLDEALTLLHFGIVEEDRPSR